MNQRHLKPDDPCTASSHRGNADRTCQLAQLPDQQIRTCPSADQFRPHTWPKIRESDMHEFNNIVCPSPWESARGVSARNQREKLPVAKGRPHRQISLSGACDQLSVFLGLLLLCWLLLRLVLLLLDHLPLLLPCMRLLFLLLLDHRRLLLLLISLPLGHQLLLISLPLLLLRLLDHLLLLLISLPLPRPPCHNSIQT